MLTLFITSAENLAVKTPKTYAAENLSEVLMDKQDYEINAEEILSKLYTQRQTSLVHDEEQASVIHADKKVLEYHKNKKTLSDEDIPEAVESDVIAESNHVARLYEEETDLNIVIFENDDNTNTLYYFDEAIKYVAEDGTVEDKSNILYDDFDIEDYEEFAYVNLDNDIRTFFPEELSADFGVALVADDCVIELSPNAETPSGVMIHPEDENSIIYDGVFGESTAIQYSTLFSGFKEDIVLYEYDENVGNQFEFILKTNGFIAEKDGLQINLIHPVSNDVAAVVSPIYVYDSFAGEIHGTYDNDMVLTLREDGYYDLIIIVDADFLINPNTVYPVYVDPTITVNVPTGASKPIEDLPVYNGTVAASLCSGSESNAYIGYRGVIHGSGRHLIRFPGLMDYIALKKLTVNQITGVTLCLNQPTVNSTYTALGLYQYTGASTWTESSTNGSITWNGLGTAVTSEFATNVNNVNLNITSVVRTWTSDATAAKRGLIIKNENNETSATYSKTFYTTNAGSNSLYVRLDYSTNADVERFFGIQGVYAPTGNYSQTFTDMTIPSVLGEIPFSRTYNSLEGINNSVVGNGFRFNYSMRVVDIGTNTYVIMPDGSWWRFTKSGTTYTANNCRGTLTLNSSSQEFVLETLEQIRYGFSSAVSSYGHLKYIEDLKGNRITVTTNGGGMVSSMSDASGLSVSFTYNSSNLITQIKDNVSGQIVKYEYTGYNLTKSTDSGGFITTYSYGSSTTGQINTITEDGQNRITLTYETASPNIGMVKTITDNQGVVSTYDYSSIASRRIKITDNTNINFNTTIDYNASYAITKSTITKIDNGITTVSDSIENTVNAFHDITSTKDIFGNTTSYAYDTKGNITKVTYPDNSIEQFTYDTSNNRTSHTDTSGVITTYTYDSFSNLTKVTRPLNGVNHVINQYEYYTGTTYPIRSLLKKETGALGDANNSNAKHSAYNKNLFKQRISDFCVY